MIFSKSVSVSSTAYPTQPQVDVSRLSRRGDFRAERWTFTPSAPFDWAHGFAFSFDGVTDAGSVASAAVGVTPEGNGVFSLAVRDARFTRLWLRVLSSPLSITVVAADSTYLTTGDLKAFG